jgi:hypothetical protein
VKFITFVKIETITKTERITNSNSNLKLDGEKSQQIGSARFN